MAKTFNIKLDMDKHFRSDEVINARMGDEGSVAVNASLFSDGTAFTPEGKSAYFECVTNNGKAVRVPAVLSGSSVSVTLPAEAFEGAGTITCAYFRFENADETKTTYSESTQSFGIIVRDSIDDKIDAEDYIAEWRSVLDELEKLLQEASSKAEEAITSIDEDVTDVSNASNAAMEDIEGFKEAVSNAASEVTAEGDKAIADFNSKSDAAIEASTAKADAALESFNTQGAAAISKVEQDGADAVSSVESAISSANASLQQNVTELDEATRKAVEAMQEALSGTTAGDIYNKLAATFNLDPANMSSITSGSDMDTLTSFKTYNAASNAIATSLLNKPKDLQQAFVMFVFGLSSTSATQVVLPYTSSYSDSNYYFFVRTKQSSGSFTSWMTCGGSSIDADAVNELIKQYVEENVPGVVKQTVTSEMVKQVEGAVNSASFDTSLTKSASLKELIVYGNTRQNLWSNPATGTSNGVTLTANANGSVTVDGTATNTAIIRVNSYVLKPGAQYTISVDKQVATGQTECGFGVEFYGGGSPLGNIIVGGNGNDLSESFTVPDGTEYVTFRFRVPSGVTVSGTYRVMLNEGTEAEPWCPPGLNSIESLDYISAGKNLAVTDMDVISAGVTISSEDDGAISFVGTATSMYPQTSNQIYLPMNTDMVASHTVAGSVGEGGRCYFIVSGILGSETTTLVSTRNRDEVAFNTGEFDFYRLLAIVEGNGVTFDCKLYPQLECGTTATDYEPPSITTTEIDLRGNALCSLPDGTHDALTADANEACSIEKKTAYVQSMKADNAAASTQSPTGAYRYYITNAVPGGKPYVAKKEDALCDALVYDADYSSMKANTCYIHGNNLFVACDKPTLEEFKTWFNSLNLSIVYELATPQTVELGSIENVQDLHTSMLNISVLNGVAGIDATFDAEVSLNGSSRTKYAERELSYNGKIDIGSDSDLDTYVNAGSFVCRSSSYTASIANLPDNVTYAFDLLVSTVADRTGFQILSEARNDASNARVYKRSFYLQSGVQKFTDWVAIGGGSGGQQIELPLSIANGGTGVTTADGIVDLVGVNMEAEPSTATDSANFVMAFSSSPNLRFRNAANVWDWIAGKVRSLFGFSSSNVLSVEHGGTGGTDTPSMLVNLASTAAASPYAASSRPGVTGTLPINRGGTGATTQKAAEFSIVDPADAGGDADDNSIWCFVNSGASASAGRLTRRTSSQVWNYIKSKADSVYATKDEASGGCINVLPEVKSDLENLTDSPRAMVNLGMQTSANVFTDSPVIGVEGVLPVSRGGTGGTTAEGALTSLGIKKSSTSSSIAEHYVLGKLHLLRISGSANATSSGLVNGSVVTLPFSMPAQPSGSAANTFTQGFTLTRYTNKSNVTVNGVAYTSATSVKPQFYAQATGTFTYDFWVAIMEA